MDKRNFYGLIIDHWYLRRDGQIVKFTEHERPNYGIVVGTYMEGNAYHRIIEHSKDIITEIEPPVIVPKKHKVTKVVRGYVESLPVGNSPALFFARDPKPEIYEIPAALTYEIEE